jgi:hypothetical protein
LFFTSTACFDRVRDGNGPHQRYTSRLCAIENNLDLTAAIADQVENSVVADADSIGLLALELLRGGGTRLFREPAKAGNDSIADLSGSLLEFPLR